MLFGSCELSDQRENVSSTNTALTKPGDLDVLGVFHAAGEQHPDPRPGDAAGVDHGRGDPSRRIRRQSFRKDRLRHAK